MDAVARYKNGHLLKLYGASRTSLVEKMCEKFAGIKEGELVEFDRFSQRVRTLA